MLRKLVSALAMTFMALPAGAAQITVQSVTGTWDVISSVGNAHISGEGTDTLSWGRPYPGYNGKKSAYVFDGLSPSGPFTENTVFDIGTFTHRNNVIYIGEYIDEVRLNLTLTAAFDGILRTFTASFGIDHWETPNDAKICANGQRLKDGGVNRNGCADRVRLLDNDSLVSIFTEGDVTYTFELLGFTNWGSDFWTVENRNNKAVIQARFSAVEDREPEEPPIVPLPAAAWMLVAGLGSLAALGARRRR